MSQASQARQLLLNGIHNLFPANEHKTQLPMYIEYWESYGPDTQLPRILQILFDNKNYQEFDQQLSQIDTLTLLREVKRLVGVKEWFERLLIADRLPSEGELVNIGNMLKQHNQNMRQLAGIEPSEPSEPRKQLLDGIFGLFSPQLGKGNALEAEVKKYFGSNRPPLILELFLANNYEDFQRKVSQLQDWTLFQEVKILVDADVKPFFDRWHLESFLPTKRTLDEIEDRLNQLNQEPEAVQKNPTREWRACSEDLAAEESEAFQSVHEKWEEVQTKFEDYIKELKDKQAAFSSNQIQTVINERYEQLTIVNERLESLSAEAQRWIDSLRNDFRNLSSIHKVESDCSYKITDPPCVIIYEEPPPSINISSLSSCREVQDEVLRNFAAFAWRYDDIDAQKGDKCNVLEPTASQLLGYHYMHPYNPHINGFMMAHSAGSGKTAGAMLIFSVFARAGYHCFFVGPSGIASINPYLNEAAFQQNMDFNIQQYLRVIRASSLLEAYNIENAESAITSEQLKDPDRGQDSRVALEAYGAKVYKKMGVSFNPEYTVMTYQKLANKAKLGLRHLHHRLSNHEFAEIKRGNMGFSERYYKGKDPEDAFEGFMFLIDEAHKMIDVDANASKERGNLFALTLGCWHSYKYAKYHPGHRAVRILLMTATPMKSHPIDLINLLNLLSTPEEDAILLLSISEYEKYAVMDTDEYENKLKTEIIPKMVRNFNNQFKFNNATGQFSNKDRLRKLLKGRVSFLNIMGDINHIATPQVIHMHVVITQTQEESIIKKCFAEAHMEYDSRKGTWIKQIKRQRTTQPPATSDWLRDAEAKYTSVSDVGNVDTKKLRKCVSKMLIWPKYNADAKKTTEIGDQVRLENAVRKYSALLGQVNANLEKLRTESIPKFRKTNMPAAIHQIKQAVYVATTDPEDVYYAAGLFAKTYRYKILNPLRDSPAVLPTGAPYKNVLVLHGRLATDQNKKILRNYLQTFNSSENIGGKKIAIIFYTSDFQEGVSFFGIGAIHVIGFVASRADLIQAIARGIRNCSHKGFPFPWRVNVYIYYSDLSATGSLKNSSLTPQDVVNSLTSNRDPALIESMSSMMEECAFDRLLNTPVNERSRKYENEFQLRSGDGKSR
jgi:hypothetical protein